MKRNLLRSLSLFLSLVLCLCLLPGPAGADDLSTEEKADALHALGLFQGKGEKEDGSPDYALSDPAARSEAATMLIRLLGRESKALAQFSAGNLTCPFTDVARWARAGVAWLYEAGYVNGVAEGLYDGGGTVTARQFSAMVLRSLGYSEQNGDYTYAGALDFAVSLGLLTADQRALWQDSFLRGGMVELCYNALFLPLRDSSLTLLEKLTNDGVFKASYDTSVAEATPLSLSLKYSGGGNTGIWYMEDGATAAPLAADLDGDGALELLLHIRTLFCLNAADGSILWSAASGHDASETGAVPWGAGHLQPLAADLNGNGKLEAVTFSRSRDATLVGVYSASGTLLYSWTTPHMVRAARLADLDGDGSLELVLGFGVGEDMDPSLYVCRPDGSLLPGWPKTCGYGIYANAIETVDLDGDGTLELVLLYDEDRVLAYHYDGSEVIASGGAYAGLPWNGLPVTENYEHELTLAEWARDHGGRASGSSDLILGATREERNLLTGTFGGVVAADVDGNGSEELVFTSMIVDGGLVMRSGVNSYEGVARYFTAFILNRDRTRYVNAARGYDWTQMPTDVGEIAALGSDELPGPDLAPVAADLDGDGEMEILFSSYDGKVHCFRLDGTEHGAWPYALDSRSGALLSFATRPAVGDLNGDGKMEVVFATYTPSGQTEVRGRVCVLSGDGAVLAEETVPPYWPAKADGLTSDRVYANGVRGVPVLADVDGDGRPEIVLTTLSCGVCVYDAD